MAYTGSSVVVVVQHLHATAGGFRLHGFVTFGMTQGGDLGQGCTLPQIPTPQNNGKAKAIYINAALEIAKQRQGCR